MEKGTQQQQYSASHLQRVTQLVSVPTLEQGLIQHNDTECFKKLGLFIHHYVRRIGPEEMAHWLESEFLCSEKRSIVTEVSSQALNTKK